MERRGIEIRLFSHGAVMTDSAITMGCYVLSVDQTDGDNDGVGDVCDNCINIVNSNQTDTDQDGTGDACEDNDTDGDGIQDSLDNCMYTPNSEQADSDADGVGDRCDQDIDGDTIANDEDNCPFVSNPLQSDSDEDYIGNACEDDYDMDGVSDKYDDCPANRFIANTDMRRYNNIDLYPELGSSSPGWLVLHQGKEVRQLISTTMPALMIGEQPYDAMDYSGTVFANSDTCDGYLGFVFGYQNNKKFYAAIWRHNYLNYAPEYAAGIKGLQIKVVNSTDGPGYTLAHGIWQSVDTGDVTLLYHDPWLRSWECKTSYRFYIKHRPEIGLISQHRVESLLVVTNKNGYSAGYSQLVCLDRVTVKHQETLITDSGDIYDTSIGGGKVGLFTYQQDFGIWSNLQVKCSQTVNRALVLNGLTGYVTVGTIDELDLDLLESFTMSVWFYLNEVVTAEVPLLCTESKELCLRVAPTGSFVATYSSAELWHNSTGVSVEGWTHVLYRYNAEDHVSSLMVNGSMVSQTAVEPHNWNGTYDITLYLGKYGDNLFSGYIDEVKIYDIAVNDGELENIWKETTFSSFVAKEHLKIYYHMNDDTDYDSSLVNLGSVRRNGVNHGSPQFVLSSVHKARFVLSYPSNRRRRSIHSYLSKNIQAELRKARVLESPPRREEIIPRFSDEL